MILSFASQYNFTLDLKSGQGSGDAPRTCKFKEQRNQCKWTTSLIWKVETSKISFP